MSLIAAEELTRRFGDFTAVDSVDIAVEPGEVVGLIGANGAGKTTLIRMLLGLLRPTRGRVHLFVEPPSIRTRRRLGYVPQGLGLYEDLTTKENLAFAAAAFGSRGSIEEDPVDGGNTLVRDLPLGSRRRAAFALALAHEPDLLVLDEPTSGVGPLERSRLWDGIRAAAEHGTGVLVTTHYMSETDQCDRVVVLVGGRLAAQGSVEEIVGDLSVVSVETEGWADAMRTLDEAGFAVALVGRTLRVAGAPRKEVEDSLKAGGIAAHIGEADATFEEAFVSLTSGS
jgi:ABC-2 type transport system ATP-binding protein